MRLQSRWFWLLLMIVGAASAASSAVPYFSNAVRITIRDDLWNIVDLSKVGTEAMGFAVEWGMLSAGLGIYLSVLMAVAGWGWWRGRAWAAWATWGYVTCGPAVTFTDLIIFLCMGKPNPVVRRLLFFDALGLAIPLLMGAWLVLRRRRGASQPVESGFVLATRRRPVLAWFLILAGVAGVVIGLVPYFFNGMHVVLGRDPWGVPDLLKHNVASMGLGSEWAMLSSAMCVYLGGAMAWAGFGWLKARPWARVATGMYVTCGLMVNVTDITIFLFRAQPGPARSQMLLADGVALAIPLALAIWLAGAARKERKQTSRR